MKNEIQLQDNLIDIFDQSEISKELFEISRAQDYTEVIPWSKPVANR